MRRMAAAAAATIGLALATVAPAPGFYAQINGQSGGYLESFRGSMKGLVTVTQNDARAVFAFNLFGLQPKTSYRLVARSKGCASRSGRVFARSFVTDPGGRAFDSLSIRVDAALIKSLAVRERASGKVVSCARRAAVPVGPDNSVIKIDEPRAVVMISEANALWELIESFSGLKPSTAYRTVALPGGCVPGSRPLFGKRFRSNAGGDAVVRVRRKQTVGKSIGSVALRDMSTGEVVFCRTV